MDCGQVAQSSSHAGCPTERFGQPVRPARLFGVGEQVPAPDHGKGIAGKPMHCADMRRVMAVEILNPEMAAGLLDKFEFIPQQACIAAKALGPNVLARPFMEP